jgi:hypothetical protein
MTLDTSSAVLVAVVSSVGGGTILGGTIKIQQWM